MADGDEPIRPRPSVPPPVPGKPLPRVWKAEPDPEPEESTRDRRSRRDRDREERETAEAEARAQKDREQARVRPKPKAKPAGKSSKTDPAGKKGVLLEETPEIDTHETRQKVRLLIGAGAALAGVVAIAFLLMSLGGPSERFEDLPDEGAQAAPSAMPLASASPASTDQEAKNLLQNARLLARNGKADNAVVVLKKLVASYPKSSAAAEARDALARPSNNLPLFLNESTVVATPGAGPAPAREPAPLVQAVEPTPQPIRPGSPAQADIHLSANPGERLRAQAGPGKSPTRALPSGFAAVAESGVHSSGWPLQILSDRDGGTMCLIPAGTFPLGRDDGAPDEGPEHRVKLGAYYIDQHEVTVKQMSFYLAETGRRPASSKTAKTADGPAPVDDMPVVNISAVEAKAYCDWAGKRLPTEAQWEAAARATDARLFPWGSSPPTWSRPRAARQIDPAMTYDLDQSPYGVFDLGGNAWEWTRDWFDPRYYQTLRGGLVENPTGPNSSRSRPPQVVVKGGSKLWYAAWREGLRPDSRFPYVGFRGVLPLDPGAETPQAIPAGPNSAPLAPAQPRATPPADSRGVVPF